MMKKNIACMLLALMGCGGAMAQTFSSSIVPWRESRLSWDDFKGMSPMVDSLNATTGFCVQSASHRLKKDGVKYYYYAFDTFRNTSEMWVRESAKTANLLKYCQADFDLLELNMRKATQEYCTDPEVVMSSAMTFYEGAYGRQSDRYRNITNEGENVEETNKMYADVQEELARTAYDPVGHVSQLTRSWGYVGSIGLEAHAPFSAYVGPCVGLTMGLQFLWRHNMLGLDIGLLAAGRCHKDIVCSDGTIHDGESVKSASGMLTYGYNLSQGLKRLEVTPFLGFGVRTYDGGQQDLEFQAPKGSHEIEIVGPQLALGCILDLALDRRVYIKYNDLKVNEHRRVIRFKPYFNFTRYSNDLGWVPAINLTVEYGSLVRRLK